ncbi:MAG: hypothetical protein SLAVMIC_00114 [uncultured marine phage]|uniref:Uncharacterized protein n=1 Tax=uncultured marine phage TaxID=707152 RepID=A0A8D9CB16_9VIRU|nr:MAG: hypothetical protein SLAVMIC_00114 [uncultured marine phage]
MRLVLDEEDFDKFVHQGYLEKEGVKIWFKKKELSSLSAGDVVTQGDIQFILSDIGFDRIYKIIGDLPHLN